MLRQEMERPDCRNCGQGRKVREMNHEDTKGRKGEGEKEKRGNGETENNHEDTRRRPLDKLGAMAGQAKGPASAKAMAGRRKHEGGKKKELIMNDKIKVAIENYEGVFGMKDLCAALDITTGQGRTQVKNVISQLHLKGIITRVSRGIYVASPGEKGRSGETGTRGNEESKDRGAHQVNEPEKFSGLATRYPASTGSPSTVEDSEDKQKESEKIKAGKEPAASTSSGLAFDPGKVVEILRDCEGMRESLVSAARDQIRTPEEQVVWYVKRGLNFDAMKAEASSFEGQAKYENLRH